MHRKFSVHNIGQALESLPGVTLLQYLPLQKQLQDKSKGSAQPAILQLYVKSCLVYEPSSEFAF